ncbi:MAG: 4'-phosphopantetheinyl transferase family protein [Oceanisphaera sp.]
MLVDNAMPTLSSRFTLIEHTEQAWPWLQPLPHLHLVTTYFDHAPLNEQDFSRSGITLPPSLHTASPKRRAEFLAGRLCAQRALLMLTHTASSPAMNADKSPLWPQYCVGSITHSDHWAAAVVAKQADYLGLGLDIEPYLSATDGQKLAPALLTQAELTLIKACSEAQFALMVTLIFSLKESLFKALYPLVGTRFYFEEAELVSWDITAGTARLRLLTHLNQQWPAGRTLDAYFSQANNHVLSLVIVPNNPAPSVSGMSYTNLSKYMVSLY